MQNKKGWDTKDIENQIIGLYYKTYLPHKHYLTEDIRNDVFM